MAAWQQPSRWGIQKGGGRAGLDNAPYAAGKIDCILRLPVPDPAIILAGSNESGVWKIDEFGGSARSLSHSWTNPSFETLVAGTRGDFHIYAGGSALMETDVSQANPLENWVEIPLIDSFSAPLNAGDINGIAILRSSQHIVLACDLGMVLAEIPPLGGTYMFSFASPPDDPIPRTIFSSVTEFGQGATAESVAFAMSGNGSPGSGGIWHGSPIHTPGSGLRLRSRRATLPAFMDTSGTVPFSADQMLRTSIDSCASHREYVYAVAADAAGLIYCVLKSVPNGNDDLVFQVAGSTITNLPPNATGPLVLFNGNSNDATGNHGDYNQCIAVSTQFPSMVAVGWRTGYFISMDGGNTWGRTPVQRDLQQHADYHALLFDQFDTEQKTVYVGNDGGINVTRDRGTTTSTLGNRRLPNLLYTKIALSNNLGNSSNPSICAGSLQDNGDVATSFNPVDGRPIRVTVRAEEWGGDGRLVVALPNGRLLNAYNTDPSVRDMQWNDQISIFDKTTASNIIPVDQPDPQGIPAVNGLQVAGNQVLLYQKTLLPVSAINSNRYTNTAGEDLVAIGAASDRSVTPGNWVYGLFLKMNSAAATNPGHWTALNSIPLATGEAIWAAGAFNEKHFFVSTDVGKIWYLKSQSGTPWNPADVYDVTPTFRGSLPGVIQFASDANHTYAITRGPFILRMTLNADGFPRWDIITNPPDFNVLGSSYGGYTSIAVNMQTRTLFVSSDTGVFLSRDAGDSWTTISGLSTGLPQWPRCMDLAVVNEDTGADYLYLATYGWSIWRLLLNNPPVEPTDVFLNGSMYFNVGHPGGDDNANPLIIPQKWTLDALNPYREFEVMNQFFDLSCQLLVYLRLRPAGVVDVDYRVNFRSQDGLDPRKNSFRLPIMPGSVGTKSIRGEWAGSSSDQMSVDFSVSI
ncbi:hypothetical protein NW759_016927 [Fusarium solani]|nr:hypothetical protein NW759_016927 [Fusarium solani]